jgi:probable addiction module antidote protein
MNCKATDVDSFHLDALLEEAPDDAAGIAAALGNIARAKGMTQVAKDAGLSRESLYRALSADGNPSFAAVLKVARALGEKLHAEAA